MQYLLTEEEYEKLSGEKSLVLEKMQFKIDDLCQMVADNMPIKLSPEGEAKPWGCIKSKLDHYCDCCPVKNDCNSSLKRFSK